MTTHIPGPGGPKDIMHLEDHMSHKIKEALGKHLNCYIYFCQPLPRVILRVYDASTWGEILYTRKYESIEHLWENLDSETEQIIFYLLFQ
jgi:hypothetical protein